MSYTLREALAAFRRAPLLTGLSAAMVGLALFVVGLFGLAAHNLREALETIEERVEVVAYLHDGAAPLEVTLAQEELAASPDVLEVVYVSKEEALRSARNDLPDFGEVFTDLEVNPLPASLEIRLRPEGRNREAVERVAERAGAFPVVEDVRYGREWVDKLFLLRRIGGVTAIVLGGAFALVAALIIGTVVRLAIFARREEIWIMRLVGARDGFIRRPFLVEGGVTGILGALLATLLTFLTYAAVDRFLFELSWIPPLWIVWGLAAGVLFGVLSSGLAVRRYIRGI